MRKAKRWRYYCDFCKKAGGSAYHMQNHENGCTLNPKRYCGMCNISSGHQDPIEKLIAIVKKHLHIFEKDCEYGAVTIEIVGNCKAMLEELGDETEYCPACMMAAIRQAGIPVPATGFDYKDAYKEFWNCHNDSNQVGSYGYY